MWYKILDENAEKLECTNSIISYVESEGRSPWGSSEMRIALATRDPNKTPALTPYLVIVTEGMTEYIGMTQKLHGMGLDNYGRGFKCDDVFSLPKK